MSIDVPARRQHWPAFAAWALGWAGMFALDDRLDLANKALVLVLSAALAAPWSGPWTSLLASAAAVLAFNFAFVPPRGRFAVDLHQHALLLATLLAVSWIVALLMTRLRRLAAQATVHAQRSDQLRHLGDALRAADEPAAQAAALQPLLAGLGGAPATLLLRPPDDAWSARPRPTKPPACACACATGAPWARAPAGTKNSRPGTCRCAAGRARHGAALLRLADAADRQADAAAPTRRPCATRWALALERAAALQAAGSAREQAQAQALRNTLLGAISHDHRTPLATILGAASALHDQGDRLSAAQRQRLAATIVDEAEQLTRLTDNTLQLARLDAPGDALRRDWESVEEMVGTVLRRVRQRDPGRRVRARVEPELPLLRCDAVLMVQVLDNLVDNALEARRRRHAGGAAGAAHRRAAADRRARPRPGRAAGAARAHLRQLPARRARRTGSEHARCRCRPGAVPRDRPGAWWRAAPAAAQPRRRELRAVAAGRGVTGARMGRRMSLHVLLVEDERELRATLRPRCRWRAITSSRRPAWPMHAPCWRMRWQHGGLDIVLLDLGLPDGDGDSLLAELRRVRGTPVLVISARPGEAQKMRLLDAGADDYLVKPFSLAELLARMRVALRHRGTALQPATLHYAHGRRRRGPAGAPRARDGAEVHLTPTEFQLLARLVRQAGQVVTHRQLLVDVWGAEFTEHTHYLRLYMGQLRAKLEADPADPQLLLTETGIGYRVAEPAA